LKFLQFPSARQNFSILIEIISGEQVLNYNQQTLESLLNKGYNLNNISVMTNVKRGPITIRVAVKTTGTNTFQDKSYPEFEILEMNGTFFRN
jgi:hypothetical protein